MLITLKLLCFLLDSEPTSSISQDEHFYQVHTLVIISILLFNSYRISDGNQMRG